MNDLWSLGSAIPLILWVLLYGVLYRWRWRRQPAKRVLLYSLMYLYVGLVLLVTLMPVPSGWEAPREVLPYGINLTPFRDLSLGYASAPRELFLNVLMMVPFGFLYPCIRGEGMIAAVLRTFLFSLAIELTQWVNWWLWQISRISDVTDLITNTTGGALGYLIFLALASLGLAGGEKKQQGQRRSG